MIVRARGLTAGIVFLTCASAAHAQPARVTETEVHAVRYGTLRDFPTAGLIGHDPLVYERFPAPGHGIARIR